MADNILSLYARRAGSSDGPQNALAQWAQTSSGGMPSSYVNALWRHDDPRYWMNPDGLREQWQANAGPESPMPTTGVAAYAAPGLASAIPQDRQSANIEVSNWFDAIHNATAWTLARKIGSVAMLAQAMAGPRIKMNEISSLLPKETIPYMGRR